MCNTTLLLGFERQSSTTTEELHLISWLFYVFTTILYYQDSHVSLDLMCSAGMKESLGARSAAGGKWHLHRPPPKLPPQIDYFLKETQILEDNPLASQESA